MTDHLIGLRSVPLCHMVSVRMFLERLPKGLCVQAAPSHRLEPEWRERRNAASTVHTCSCSLNASDVSAQPQAPCNERQNSVPPLAGPLGFLDTGVKAMGSTFVDEKM